MARNRRISASGTCQYQTIAVAVAVVITLASLAILFTPEFGVSIKEKLRGGAQNTLNLKSSANVSSQPSSFASEGQKSDNSQVAGLVPDLGKSAIKSQCLVDLYPRPGPTVKSKDGKKFLEVSFLNHPEMIPDDFPTKPRCEKGSKWDEEAIGRPIKMPTSIMQERAVKVGHPHLGILDPKGSYVFPPRKCTLPVPRILHFIWVCCPLPFKNAERIVKFAEVNPNWEIMLWVDNDVSKNESQTLERVKHRPGGPVQVHTLESHAQHFRNIDVMRSIRQRSLDPRHKHVCAGISDFARLEVVYKYGGIYMDTDFVAYRGFDDYGDLFRWPFVTHKVCGVNIINSFFGSDAGSGFLDFALNASRQNCLEFSNCMPEGGAGPPFFLPWLS